MKAIKIKHGNYWKQYILGMFICLFVLSISINNIAVAQTTDSLTETLVEDSSAVSSTTEDSGPSVGNISKTSAAVTQKLQEEARWREIKDIIGMVVGFIIVVVVAWYLATWARKLELKKAEEKRVRVEKALIKKGFTVVPDSEKKSGDGTVALKPPPGHLPPKRRR